MLGNVSPSSPPRYSKSPPSASFGARAVRAMGLRARSARYDDCWRLQFTGQLDAHEQTLSRIARSVLTVLLAVRQATRFPAVEISADELGRLCRSTGRHVRRGTRELAEAKEITKVPQYEDVLWTSERDGKRWSRKQTRNVYLLGPGVVPFGAPEIPPLPDLSTCGKTVDNPVIGRWVRSGCPSNVASGDLGSNQRNLLEAGARTKERSLTRAKPPARRPADPAPAGRLEPTAAGSLPAAAACRGFSTAGGEVCQDESEEGQAMEIDLKSEAVQQVLAGLARQAAEEEHEAMGRLGGPERLLERFQAAWERYEAKLRAAAVTTATQLGEVEHAQGRVSPPPRRDGQSDDAEGEPADREAKEKVGHGG